MNVFPAQKVTLLLGALVLVCTFVCSTKQRFRSSADNGLNAAKLIQFTFSNDATGLTNVAEADGKRCEQPEDRCLPIRFCQQRHYRTVHAANSNLSERIECNPEMRIDSTPHVCCPKTSIQCRWRNKPAACQLLEHCVASPRNKIKPNYQVTNLTTLCYVHNNQNYFCCPEHDRVLHGHRCVDDPQGAPRSARNRSRRMSENGVRSRKHFVSAFRSCSHDGRALLVPRALCDDEFTFVRGSTSVCCRLPDGNKLISHPKAAAMADVPCGGEENLITARISGGTDAEEGKYPWMALLVYKKQVLAFCAGTLIHRRYVLTAAHCVTRYGDKLEKVSLGVDNVQQYAHCNDENDAKCPPAVQKIWIERKIAHEQHDIALLKLQTAAVLVKGLVPICLPITRRLLVDLPANLIITGWGKTETPRVKPKKKMNRIIQLQEADVEVVLGDPDCKGDHFVCVGGSGKNNTCYGDSGGPYQAEVFYMADKRFVQYGVISAGAAVCGKADRPSIGMLIPYFMSWILDMMELDD